MMAFSQFQRSRAVYENVRWTFESEQGGRASDLSHQEPSAEAPGSSPHHQHPTRNCLSSGHADSVRLRITGTAEKPSPSRSESVPERRAELPILIRDCTRQAVSRLSFGPEV